MTIYVDELQTYTQRAQPGAERYFGGGKQSCHMWTDGDLEELHRFAESIGMRRSWFQNHRALPHYDLTPSRRRLAVQHRAREVSLLDYLRQQKVSKPDDEINRLPRWVADDARGIWAIVRDYWREEVRRESVALARLERICEQRGWDYAATRRVLS